MITLNLDQIWQAFLKIIYEEVGSRIVETWFKAVSFMQWDKYSKTVYLKVPNKFVKDWISTHYADLFKLHLSRLLNEDSILIIFLEQSKSIDVFPSSQNIIHYNRRSITNLKVQQFPAISKESRASKGQINQNFKFDTFVVGPNNSLAFAAAQAIAEKPGNLYNPLFIYGDSGLGKTHLLHAVANKIKSVHSHFTILYQSADRFVNEFIHAIRFNKVHIFENRYKNVDALLIDDIQFISNKEQTQEIFFYIFNTLYEARKQIVFSSDSLPQDISGLADRLRSRLDGGLVTDIQAPSLETKIAILKRKSEFHKESLNDEVAYFLASHSSSNIRELEGLLIRLIAFASLTHQSVTIDLAQKVLSRTAKNGMKKKLFDLQFIASRVARYYDYSLTDLRSGKRHKGITLARHVAMYLMKKYTDSSLSDIGVFWCRKDHSTVINALEKVEQFKKKDEVFKNNLDKLEHIIVSS